MSLSRTLIDVPTQSLLSWLNLVEKRSIRSVIEIVFEESFLRTMCINSVSLKQSRQ
jgi:hypothetical protein